MPVKRRIWRRQDMTELGLEHWAALQLRPAHFGETTGACPAHHTHVAVHHWTGCGPHCAETLARHRTYF